MLIEEVVVDKSLWDRRAMKDKPKKVTRISVSLRDKTRRKMRNYQRRMRNTKLKDYSKSAALARQLHEYIPVRLANGLMGKRRVVWWQHVPDILRMSDLTMQRAWVAGKIPRPSCVAKNVRGLKKYYLLSEVQEFINIFSDADLLYLTPSNPITSSLFAIARVCRDNEGVPA